MEAHLLPRTRRLKLQTRGGMLHAFKMGVELHDAPFQKRKAFKNGVAAMHHVIVQRHQQQTGVLADRSHAMFVKGP